MARAIAGDPAALVADEPTAHLDSEAGAALLDLLQALVRERDMAAVVASHDPAVIARADRVIRLRDGAAVAA
jgi:putative ABC transport system ATP-binding protein